MKNTVILVTIFALGLGSLVGGSASANDEANLKSDAAGALKFGSDLKPVAQDTLPERCTQKTKIKAEGQVQLVPKADGRYEFHVVLENPGAAAKVCLSRFYETGLPLISLAVTAEDGKEIYSRVEVHMKPGDRMYEAFTFPASGKIDLAQSFQPERPLKNKEIYLVSWRVGINVGDLRGTTKGFIE